MPLHITSFENFPLELRLQLVAMSDFTAPYFPKATTCWKWDASNLCPAGWAFHAVGRPGQTLLGFLFEGESPRVRLGTFKELMDERHIPDYAPTKSVEDLSPQHQEILSAVEKGPCDARKWPESVVADLYKWGFVDWTADTISMPV